MELGHRDTIQFQSATLKENICKKNHFYRDAISSEVLSKFMSLVDEALEDSLQL